MNVPGLDEVAGRLDKPPHQLDEAEQAAGMTTARRLRPLQQSSGIAKTKVDDSLIFGVVRQAARRAGHFLLLLSNVRRRTLQYFRAFVSPRCNRGALKIAQIL